MNLKTNSLMIIVTILLLATPLLAQNQSAPQAPAVPVELTVPAGFQASVFASGVTGARLMTVAPDGTIYVAKQRAGEVVALPDKNKDGKADEIIVIAKGLSHPHSLVFRKGYLYIATIPAVVRMKYANGKVEGTPEKFVDLPISTPGQGHITRTIAWGKDNRLYVSIGSSCNVCEEPDDRRTTIMVFNEDGSGGKPFAKGLRNSIGIDFDPKTGKLWGGDMGQDGLGAEKPGDEINMLEEGKHYGFPYFVGNNEANAGLKDAKGSMKPEQCTPPAFSLDAHSSPIDLRFYTGKKFPSSYRGAMFMALHGSNNNRPQKIGYKVVRVVMKNGKPVGVEDFATGWLKDNQFNGRPAGLITGADGALYISDDNKGFIYRVSYGK
ncbi:MAG: PQQ-dependent sugar dehydrogenase [Acidobacteria bacterium]|nr:PQQ-dependent sugar dehydrogenase [Acidobacteriota bacterium]